jgi:hypothetical protein
MVLTLEREGFIKGNRAAPAASNCSVNRNTCQSYFDPRFNRPRSLCSGY